MCEIPSWCVQILWNSKSHQHFQRRHGLSDDVWVVLTLSKWTKRGIISLGRFGEVFQCVVWTGAPCETGKWAGLRTLSQLLEPSPAMEFELRSLLTPATWNRTVPAQNISESSHSFFFQVFHSNVPVLLILKNLFLSVCTCQWGHESIELHWTSAMILCEWKLSESLLHPDLQNTYVWLIFGRVSFYKIRGCGIYVSNKCECSLRPLLKAFLLSFTQGIKKLMWF